MKFVPKISKIGRTGSLIDLPTRWSHLSITTPLSLGYTCSGIFPHLTSDVLRHIDIDSRGLGWVIHPLPTVVEFKDAVEDLGKGLGEFVGLQSQPFHVSVQDPATKTLSGYNTKKGASVWTYGGKKLLTAEDFISVQKCFLPFSYQALCDSDTPFGCSSKRLNKSIDNTLNFLDQCIQYHSQVDELKDTIIFGTIQGGYDSKLRKLSATETVKRSVDGFVIDGFHINGPEVRSLSFNKIEPLLLEVLELLPQNKPRMINGPMNLHFILQAVKCGIDMFDSSYPYLLTECGEALSLPFLFDDHRGANTDATTKNIKYSLELDLKDVSFAKKFGPIVENCDCYCCKNFTCAYVHHLLVTSELLGKVLLMIHNMFQFSEFFAVIRDSIQNETFDQLESYFSPQQICA